MPRDTSDVSLNPADPQSAPLAKRPTNAHAPAFICLGAQKAGTDWIYDQFGAHRDFWQAPIKEIDYLRRGIGHAIRKTASRRLRWMYKAHIKGKSDYTHEISFLLRFLKGSDWLGPNTLHPYFGLFENRPGRCFDCSPQYVRLSKHHITSALAQMPSTKFFMILRDPSARLWSQRLMFERLNSDNGKNFADTDLVGWETFAKHPSVVKQSFLSHAVRRWQAVAKPDQFKSVFFDDLTADAEAFRADLCEFLGADPTGFSLPAEHNRKAAQPGKRPPPQHIRVWMASFFEQEYADLADLVGGHAAKWRARNDEILASQLPGL